MLDTFLLVFIGAVFILVMKVTFDGWKIEAKQRAEALSGLYR